MFPSNFDIRKFMKAYKPGWMSAKQIKFWVNGVRKGQANPEFTAMKARIKTRYDIEMAALSRDMKSLACARIGPLYRRVEHLALTHLDTPIRDALAFVLARARHPDRQRH